MSNTEPQTINKAIWISYKGSPETPLHFISRYKGDSVGRYRRYPIRLKEFGRKVAYANHEPQLRQSSGVSREHAIASILVASARFARPSTVSSSAFFCSTVNWIASAAALVRK